MTESVHLRHLSLDLPPDVLTPLARTLSSEEAVRAARFHLAADRRRFIAGRGLLRGLLGTTLNRPPGHLVFDYGPHGKPILTGDDSHLRFNFSRSGDIALVALAFGRDVGVDIERIRPDLDAASLAAHILPAAEADAVLALPPDAQPDAFFRAWVRREAYLKALGVGFSAPTPLPFDADLWTHFDVDVGPYHRAALVVGKAP